MEKVDLAPVSATDTNPPALLLATSSTNDTTAKEMMDSKRKASEQPSSYASKRQRSNYEDQGKSELMERATPSDSNPTSPSTDDTTAKETVDSKGKMSEQPARDVTQRQRNDNEDEDQDRRHNLLVSAIGIAISHAVENFKYMFGSLHQALLLSRICKEIRRYVISFFFCYTQAINLLYRQFLKRISPNSLVLRAKYYLENKELQNNYPNVVCKELEELKDLVNHPQKISLIRIQMYSMKKVVEETIPNSKHKQYNFESKGEIRI
jgi:hypothetical protein